MKKNDLKVGYVVKNREGNLYMVMEHAKDGLIIIREDEKHWNQLCHFKDDLTNHCFAELDIVEVYGFPDHWKDAMRITDGNRPLLWKREKAKKMTVEEVEKELGYKIEIVSDH